MKKFVALFAALGIFSSIAVLANPQADKQPAPDKKKVTDVWTCPMTMETIKDHKTATKEVAVVGTYRVHFCCGGCPDTFAKLSAKDKLAKATEAAKKDAAANKKTDDPKKS
jgi:hypothetical protein